ncbi:MAG: hypothetical protein ABIE22_00190 [archaeon]
MKDIKFFREILDRVGNVVHGSFLENLDTIIGHGICPPSMLPKETKPKKFFGGRSEEEAYCGTNADYFSTFVIGDWNRYSLTERRVWSPFYHYFIVADHSEWGSDRKSQEAPWHIHSAELTLYNQSIAPCQFKGIVIPTNADIAELLEDEKGQAVFGNNGRRMSSEDISDKLIKIMVGHEFLRPIYDFNGNRVYTPD